VRDAVVDFVRTWSGKTELPAERFLGWLELARGKFFAWRQRYGRCGEDLLGARRKSSGGRVRKTWLWPPIAKLTVS
jgi:hypothetical protein